MILNKLAVLSRVRREGVGRKFTPCRQKTYLNIYSLFVMTDELYTSYWW